jgi:hypothetical protein
VTLSPIARNVLDMALRNNGYHIAVEAPEGWLGADATFAPGRCFVSYVSGGRNHAIVAPSLPQVARAFGEEGHAKESGAPLPPGACAAFTVTVDALPGAVRRIFELSRSLPTAPLDRFMDKVRALPRTTEAERLVVQRVGQDIFREALSDLWFGRCAVTGLDQPELLRASHMKAWADCESDAERLDPMNGLLLAAHWDAAFDRGLVTFEDDGTPLLSSLLSVSARALLVPASGAGSSGTPRLTKLRNAHLPYLRYHRDHVWRA